MSMSKGFAFVLVLVFLTASCIMVVKPVSGASAVDNSWVERAPMPTGEYFLGAVSVNGEIYAIGSGFTYVYNPATDVWVSKTPMPTNQQHFAIAACQGKIYVIGGWNSTDPNTGYPILTGANEMYDRATGTWEAKAPLPTPTDYVQANVVNGEIYVMGGSTWVYDPSNDSWSTAAPIPTPVYGYASAVVNNKIYIEGGQSGNNGQLSNLNQIYDPETNVWTIGSPLPTAVNYAAAGVTTGVLAPTRLYVMGGVTRATDGVRGVDTVQIYDPQADSWVNGSSMPTSRLGLAVAVVNDTLFAIGGVLVWGFGFVTQFTL